jgi:hypothetical protein
MDRLAHGLVVAAQVVGNRRRPLAASAREHALAPAQHKGLR